MAEPHLKILAIVPSPKCYGLQNLTLSFFGRLSPSVRAHFITTHWSDGDFVRRLNRLGISNSATWLGMFSRKLDRTNLRMTLECLLKLPIAWYHFSTCIVRQRPDIIYLANHHEAILLFPFLVPLRKHVVCHIHDPPPDVSFQRWSFSIWKQAVGRFVFISHSARHRLSLLGRLDDQDVVIYNGVAVKPSKLPRMRSDRFIRQFNWQRDCVVVAMTGQMIANKGGEDFLVAADAVRRRSPNARFVIGGPAEGTHFETLCSLTEKLALQGLVGFPGWLPSPSDFFAAIDLLVVPSRHEEGFGLVAAEAGEQGIPVVATRSGGITEIVLDRETGFIVDHNDPNALADRLVTLVQDEHLRNFLGQAGRKRIVEKFNLDVQVTEFQQFLKTVAR